MSWERQFESMLASGQMDFETMRDLGVAYAAETEDDSILRSGLVPAIVSNYAERRTRSPSASSTRKWRMLNSVSMSLHQYDEIAALEHDYLNRSGSVSRKEFAYHYSRSCTGSGVWERSVSMHRSKS